MLGFRFSGNERALKIIFNLVFFVFIVLAVRYQIELLGFNAFEDEAETIVAAKMMASGQRLYSEIFNHHGPLTFLPGYFLEKFGSFGVSTHRIAIAVLQMGALTSIYFSPLLINGFTRKAYTIAVAAILLLYIPDFFGNMYIYQVIAGLLIVIVLSQYTLPTIMCPESLSGRQVIFGNILIASLPFLAITYLPISILLFLSSLRNAVLTKSLVAFAGGVFVNIAFLVGIGSVAGFLAFHVYLNAEVLPLYSGAQSIFILIQNAFNAAVGSFRDFLIFALLISAISRMATSETGVPWRSFLIGLGIASLLIRGVEFHNLPYYYSFLAVSLVLFTGVRFVAFQAQLVILIFSMACIAKLSLLLPGDRQRLESSGIPVDTEFSRLVQEFTSKDDRIISYSFNNNEYIAADRLPASGHFFYLPWQEKYNENPKYGISINACREIVEYRPKVMLVNKWKVWGLFSWESYAGCVQSVLDKQYVQVPERPYYIRKDLLSGSMGLTSSLGSTIMKPSPELGASTPIKILMASEQQNEAAAIKRIGIMFGLYGRQNPGEAELHLRGPDGSEFIQRFALPYLGDNKYRYFDIDSKIYTEGEIVSVSGGGISTWESHSENGVAQTCVTYEYADGKRLFTSGCPFF